MKISLDDSSTTAEISVSGTTIMVLLLEGLSEDFSQNEDTISPLAFEHKLRRI
ncbi:hypothetical protein [Tenuifilum sp.]|uniref:hypothetical protein n=1 Tax=Tenuifilum sp. TaxID=2760880 RepID=UPI00403E86D5